jgi:phosphonate ABC transporter permease subunit PhnE
LADLRSQDPDAAELGQEEARVGASAPVTDPARPAEPRRRRPLFFLLALVLGIVVYAIAFQQTQVSLDEITSETRQQSLARILRALAQPELVTYDTRDSVVETEIGVPCGPSLTTSDRLILTPECAAPGGTVTVAGTGFEPRENVEIEFVPDSEFTITLRMAAVTADADGNISAEFTLPDRESEKPQQILAVTQESIGTWRNRVEVYTDANENGVEDNPILGDSGDHSLIFDGDPAVPAVALLDPAGEAVQFVTTGETFEAVTGQARGQTALPLGEDTTTGLRVTAIEAGDGGQQITFEGDPGTDMTNWRAALYDGASGEVGTVSPLSDTIQLSPRISDTAKISWDKILETVFLALIATTAGVVVSVPLSFIAARNIMRDISITVTNLVLVLLAIPAGIIVGIGFARLVHSVFDPLTTGFVGALTVSLFALGISWLLVRTAIQPEDLDVPTRADRAKRGGMLLVAGAAGLVGLLGVARLLQHVGGALATALSAVDFLGSFLFGIGEILDVTLTVIAALATAGVATAMSSRFGYAIRSRTPRPLLQVGNLVLAAVSGAVWAVLIGQVVDWLYQIGDSMVTVIIPAMVGAVLGLLVAWRGMHKGEVEIGLSIYYAARTVFNALRSVEPLIMAIVFVVWVGIGPFAGSLALALHTAAALAKLYSEQVESISAGPIEAVRATGANRLQTIVYAVVPQVVPPYISFTMYRWDINVRMSTILGFVGGGGIGSILQQNVNLLQYRAAAVQMLAIAIVVATMDYASSRMREHFV